MSVPSIRAHTTDLITQPDATITLSPTQTWTNAGILNVNGAGASLAFDFGAGNSGSGMQFIGNRGIMEATAGGDLTLWSVGSPHTPTGTINNTGQIVASAGRVGIQTAIQQSGAGQIDIYNGGTVALLNPTLSKVTGGRVDFASGGGTLSTSVSPATVVDASQAPTLDLLGPAILAYAGPSGGGVNGLAETYDAGSHTLSVFDNATTPIAAYHVAGNVAASQFSISDSRVVFTPHSH